jgi:carboxypeptidase C (cathepsin A)
MAWAGAAEFAAAPLTAWSVDGRVAGEARAARGLTFLNVHDAGHMVPMDQVRRHHLRARVPVPACMQSHVL